MATAELSVGRRSRAAAARDWFTLYTGLWAATGLGFAVVSLAGSAGSETTRGLLGLTLSATQNPPPAAGHILALAAHNIPIAAWPLLLGAAGAERHRHARRGADVLLAASALANALPVGAALAAYGTPLLAYIPQLPLEWAALAVGYGSWLRAREQRLTTTERAGYLMAIVIVLLASAVLETGAVPHRHTPAAMRGSAGHKRLRGITS